MSPLNKEFWAPITHGAALGGRMMNHRVGFVRKKQTYFSILCNHRTISLWLKAKIKVASSRESENANIVRWKKQTRSFAAKQRGMHFLLHDWRSDGGLVLKCKNIYIYSSSGGCWANEVSAHHSRSVSTSFSSWGSPPRRVRCVIGFDRQLASKPHDGHNASIQMSILKRRTQGKKNKKKNKYRNLKKLIDKWGL